MVEGGSGIVEIAFELFRLEGIRTLTPAKFSIQVREANPTLIVSQNRKPCRERDGPVVMTCHAREGGGEHDGFSLRLMKHCDVVLGVGDSGFEYRGIEHGGCHLTESFALGWRSH